MDFYEKQWEPRVPVTSLVAYAGVLGFRSQARAAAVSGRVRDAGPLIAHIGSASEWEFEP